MQIESILAAQRGIPLATVMHLRHTPSLPPDLIHPDAIAPPMRISPPKAKAKPKAVAPLTGPFLSPGALTRAERLRLLDGMRTIIEGVYTHLPLKRARYGFDPVQRLSILRTQVDELTDDGFHAELADIVTRLRDAHTRYVGPTVLGNKVAALPFLVEMCGTPDGATYVVTKVGHGLDPAFAPGVELEFWNGVPIDRAVQRYSDREVGGRPDSQRAWAVQSLTLRSLQFGPPPDELWVVVGYRTAPKDGTPAESREIKIAWQIVDPGEIAPILEGGPTGRREDKRRLARAVDPAAEAVRRAKMLLYAPQVLLGRQPSAPASVPKRGRKPAQAATIIPTHIPRTLKVMSIDAPGGAFAYLRIYAFDAQPTTFINELQRLVPLLPDRGLIIDVRGNPGGYIWAAELALQLFTPRHIEPTRFSTLATPFTRTIASAGGVAEELEPWKTSLEAAVRNGELYAQPMPITDPTECNALGQQYGGPVVLLGDATTYSAGDLFSAGFVDNGIGPFLCVGSATGAGGANVWSYAEMRDALAGSTAALPALPDGIDLSFAFRRATRSGPMEGIPIEDVGVTGTPCAMTRDDLLANNVDLIARCITVLKAQPFSRLTMRLDKTARKVFATTDGLDRLDVLFDGHPGASHAIGADGKVTVTYPAGTKTIDVGGYAGTDLRQRRRIAVTG